MDYTQLVKLSQQILTYIEASYPTYLPESKEAVKKALASNMAQIGIPGEYFAKAARMHIQSGEKYPPSIPQLITLAKQIKQDEDAERERPFYEAVFREAEETDLLPPSKEEQAEIDAEAQRKFDERWARINAATRKSKTPEP